MASLSIWYITWCPPHQLAHHRSRHQFQDAHRQRRHGVYSAALDSMGHITAAQLCVVCHSMILKRYMKIEMDLCQRFALLLANVLASALAGAGRCARTDVVQHSALFNRYSPIIMCVLLHIALNERRCCDTGVARVPHSRRQLHVEPSQELPQHSLSLLLRVVSAISASAVRQAAEAVAGLARWMLLPPPQSPTLVLLTSPPISHRRGPHAHCVCDVRELPAVSAEQELFAALCVKRRS
eukprot:TRINITY_DN2139_c0_g1_i1.p1 TRINITY_DN2139_c0_g1~~TRINITY_DN2139_c0_g1_i1.p1  ORF type:complete len:239 (-),score=3.78 TRINITY_DN2139_c0_g1_i1:783-1499(-)